MAKEPIMRYYVQVFVTSLVGTSVLLDEPLSFATREGYEAYIAYAQQKRSEWDDDGFNSKVEYVVRYGKPGNWNPKERVVTFEYRDATRSFSYVTDNLVAVSN